jgi:two-component system sensor histidine kinase MtrB
VIVLAALGFLVAALLGLELRRRERLLRDAVHELRGPLGAVSLGLETVARAPDAARRAGALQAELARAALAVDDVAAAARGRREPAREEVVSLHEVARSSAEAWSAAAERRGGRIRFDWPAGRSQVRADPRRLAQVLGNLLANAVEHGGADVVLRGRATAGSIRVEVADRGEGVRSRTGRGRGRGLLIAERALARTGGQLHAAERGGGGRVAVAEIPLERAA